MRILGSDWSETHDTIPQYKLGTIAMEDIPGSDGETEFWGNRVFKYVQVSYNNLSPLVGYVMIYLDFDGYKNSKVTANRAASVTDIGAGVLMGVPADQGYAWMQIRGFTTAAVTLAGSAGDGDMLTVIGSGTGALTKLTDATAEPIVAQALDASDKQINCMFPF